MTMIISGEALAAYSLGSEATGEHFGALAGVFEQARVSDDCFGPLGEFLAFAYFNNVEECQQLATQAKTYMSAVSAAVTDTAKNYSSTDTGEAGTYGQLSGSLDGPGGIGSVNAGDGKSKGYLEQHAGYGSSWVNASSDLADAGTPPEIAIATVNARMQQLEAVTSPGQAFFDNGLGFLIGLVISPLVEFVLEPAIGDPEQMRSTGEGWEKIAQWVEGAGEHEKQRSDATQPVWEGEAGDAFRAEMAEFAEGAKAMASDIRGLKENLDLAADLFDLFVETVIDIIQELVIGLIIEWIAALAASWITAGASVAAATGLTTAQVAITGTRLGTKVANLLHKLKPIFTKLEDLLKALRTGRLRTVVSKMENLRDGNMAQKYIARKIDSNPAFKILTKGDAATGVSKSSANVFGKNVTGEQALAQNVADAGLRMAGLSGTTTGSIAATNAAMENVPGAVIEYGVEKGYNKAMDPSTEEERRADTDRGFTLNE
ncbi:WXG100 family type VII secretion target [Actinokineospora xionganensis]|uniref:WXG100 family type VII secretion target n=1 Tax=Actinokineospora xionganensis TaxID=2684470 RepID=A0ABR7L2F3_9PSEU|nr:WXG100 family type VII secretion target [Actinokineospora xionganensis]MBC6446870.1 WXG100 family type VII secretion target [Actinokineospora xionganensis]